MPGFVRRELGRQIPDDMSNDVEAGDVQRTKRGALRTSERRACDGVDVFDRKRTRLECTEDPDQAIQTDPIGDEVRRVLRDDHAFAQLQIQKSRHARHDARIGVAGRDHFDERQITWRIEEVSSEPSPPELRWHLHRDRRHRKPAGVGCHNGLCPDMRRNLLQ